MAKCQTILVLLLKAARRNVAQSSALVLSVTGVVFLQNTLIASGYENVGSMYLLRTKTGCADCVIGAISMFEEAANRDGPNGNANAVVSLGKTYFVMTQWKKAAELLERSLSLAPTDTIAHYYLAMAYQNQGRIGDARNQLQLAAAWPLLRADHAERGLTLLESELPFEAEGEFRDLIRAAAKEGNEYWTAEGYHWLGWSLERQGKHDDAVGAYQLAAGFRTQPGPAAAAMIDLARLLAKVNKFAESAKLIDEAVRLGPTNRFVLLSAGELYQASGNCAKAKEFYKSALPLPPFDNLPEEKIASCSH